MNILVIIVFIVIIAALATLLFLSNRKMEAKQQEFNKISQDRQNEFNQRLDAKQREYDGKMEAKQQEFSQTLEGKQQELRELDSKCAALQQQLNYLEKEQQEQEEQSKLTFSKVASELLAQHGKAFGETSHQQIAQLLTPFSQSLAELKKSIEGYATRQVEYSASLRQQIQDLGDMNRNIGKEARELANALRGNSKMQGDWGELMLTHILQQSGLIENENYHLQVTRNADGSILKGENGESQRPDVVLHLPDGKNLVVDSKVVLTAFTQFINDDEEEQRKAHLAEHLKAVKKHVDELARKQYGKSVENAADFVLMFIPNEPAYLHAMHADPDLWQYAYRKNVVIVSPTHLISTVKLIDQLWTRERQTKNVLSIAEEAGKMLDKFAGFVDDMKGINKALTNAQNSYDEAMKKLSTGRGSLLSKAQKIQQMGAKATKQLPKPVEEELALPASAQDSVQPEPKEEREAASEEAEQ